MSQANVTDQTEEVNAVVVDVSMVAQHTTQIPAPQ